MPVQRNFGLLSTPRIRVGTIPLDLGGAHGRVRVIADLPMPPLAATSGRGLYSVGGHRRLLVHSAASQAYLQRVAQAQARAIALLKQAIPQAKVGRRFRILLDGLTLTLPAKLLPKLVRQSYVTHVYPSVQYTMADDTSNGVIGADVLHQVTGADGTGIKIGIVDDGIDQTNPFFNPAGFSYPAGFPKGDTKYTTPKVIVAKVFPGPNSGAPGHLPLDPDSSFHGTHVAGIAAGVSGTTAPAGSDHPEVTGLSGVAPKAWLGNYRVFTVPTPVGHVANTPEIIAAFEAAVADGMNVINFSGGGPQVEPANDALIEAVHNVAAAGVVPVIAAGNDRDDFGTGSTGSPGTAPDAISVAAVSNTHVFAPALDVTAPGAPSILQGIPFQGAGGIARAGRLGLAEPDADRRRLDRRHRRQAGRAPPLRRRSRSDLDAGHAARALAGREDRARAARPVPVRDEGGAGEGRRRGRDHPLGQPPGRGEPDPDPAAAPGRHDRESRRRPPARGHGRDGRADDHPRRPRPARARDGPQRRHHQLLVGRPDRPSATT